MRLKCIIRAVRVLVAVLVLLGVAGAACGDDQPSPGAETAVGTGASTARAAAAPSATAAAAVDGVPPVAFESGELRIDGTSGARAIEIEFAITTEQFSRGLGFRDELPPDAGMLFVMEEPRVPNFWMRGMRFPLDFVWVGEDRRVISITPDVPHEPGVEDAQLKRYSPGVSVAYVLELNAGAAARLGIVPGTALEFELP